MRQLLNEAADKTRGEAIKNYVEKYKSWTVTFGVQSCFLSKTVQKIPTEKSVSSAIFIVCLRNETSTWLFYFCSVPIRFYSYAQSIVFKHLPFMHYIIRSAPAIIHICFVSFVLFFSQVEVQVLATAALFVVL